MYRWIGGLILIASSVLVAATSASGKSSFVIVADTTIGGFPRAGTVQQAIDVFGPPVSRQDNYETCVLRWPGLGLTMKTYYPDAQRDPCGGSAKHVLTTATDRRWRTSKGLRIGDPVSRLRALYPRAKQELPGRWYLTIRWLGVPLPGLEANVERGRVASFTVYGPRIS